MKVLAEGVKRVSPESSPSLRSRGRSFPGGDCTHFYTAAPPNDLLRFKLPSATFVVASFTRNEFIDATIGGFKVAER